jgi:hypothetical protein
MPWEPTLYSSGPGAIQAGTVIYRPEKFHVRDMALHRALLPTLICCAVDGRLLFSALPFSFAYSVVVCRFVDHTQTHTNHRYYVLVGDNTAL